MNEDNQNRRSFPDDFTDQENGFVLVRRRGLNPSATISFSIDRVGRVPNKSNRRFIAACRSLEVFSALVNNFIGWNAASGLAVPYSMSASMGCGD